MLRDRGGNELWKRGSLTVEAAFIVPILLGVIFVIMYILFLYHDRVVLQENGQRVLRSMAEETVQVNNYTMKKEAEESLWIVRVKAAKVVSKRRTVAGAIDAEVRWNIPVMSFFLNDMQEIHWAQKISSVHPEETVEMRNKNGRNTEK